MHRFVAVKPKLKKTKKKELILRKSLFLFICKFMSMCENIHACVRLGLHARDYVNVMKSAFNRSPFPPEKINK